MTQWIITSSVLIVIIVVLRFLLRGKISLKLQYALWGLVLIRLLIPFSVFESSVSVLNLMQEREETFEPPVYYEPYAPGTINPGVPDDDIYILDDYVEQIAPETNITIDKEGFVTEPEIRVIDWGDVLKGVRLAGTAVFGAVFAVSNLRFRKKLMNTREYVPGTKAWLPVYESIAVKTPCLFGAIKPAIYVTKEVLEHEKVLSHVLEHETTHYRHGDHIWSVLRCFCLALHWYNPLVWLAAFLSMRDSELACDEDTIRRIGEDERIGYGRTLINLTCEKPAVGILSAATTMTGSKSSIKERIMLIAKKPKMLKITAVLVAVIAVFAVVFTFTSAEKYNPKTTDKPVTEQYFSQMEHSPSDYLDKTGKISMTVTKVSSDRIVTEVTNKTECTFNYSVGYRLHFEQDGKWYELPMLDEYTSDMLFFSVDSHPISPNKTSGFENDVQESYGKLPAGKYRILRTFKCFDEPDAESFVLAAEFTVSEPKGIFGRFSKGYSEFFPGAVGTDFLNGGKAISNMVFYVESVDSPDWNVPFVLSEEENKTIDEILDGYNFTYIVKGKKDEEKGRLLYSFSNSNLDALKGTEVFYLGLGKDMVSPGICKIQIHENSVTLTLDIASCKNPADFSEETFDFGPDYISFVSKDRELTEKLIAFCNKKANVSDSSALAKTVYVPVKNIFTHHLSSFIGIPEVKYKVTDDAFIIINSKTGKEKENFSVPEWKWQELPYSEEEWNALFLDFLPFPDISEYQSRYYLPLDDMNFVAAMDDELWLCELSPEKPSSDDLWVWSIYRIVSAAEAENNRAYWEAAPALSSRSPWFEFEFDLDYSKITAKISSEIGEGSFYDIESTENLYSVEIEKGENLRWVPHNGAFGFVLSATVDFEVYDGEKIIHRGSLEILNTGSTNHGAMYEATLVSKTLSLRESSEFAGGHISLKTSEPGIDYDYYSGRTESARNEFGFFSGYDDMAEFTFAVPDLSGKDFSEFPFVEENPEWCVNGTDWVQQDGNFPQALFKTAEAEELAKAVALLNGHYACFSSGSESFRKIYEANPKELLWEAILQTPVRGRYPAEENHALTAILEAGSEAAGYEIYALEIYSVKDVEKTFRWLFGENADFVPQSIPAFGIRYFEEIGLFVQFFDGIMTMQDYPQILSYSEKNGIYEAEVIMASALNEGFDEIGFGIKLTDGSTEFLPITAENVKKAAEVETHYIYTFEKADDGHFVLLSFRKIPGVKTENPAEEPSGSNTEIEIGGRVFYFPKVEGAGLSYSDKTLTAKYTQDTDLSNLFPLIYAEEIEYLEIYAEKYSKVMVLPAFPNVKNLYIELGEKVGQLDISPLENLGQLTVFGEAEEIFLPEKLESVSTYGQTDLSLFLPCKSIKNIEILGKTDLSVLSDFPNLETVTIRTGECDLSLLNSADFSKLVLSNIGDEELSAIDGCPVDTLQISDADLSELGIIRRLPNLEVIFLTVSGGENPFVTTFMTPSEDDLDKLKTPADVSVLKEFIENGGTVYLIPDWNR